MVNSKCKSPRKNKKQTKKSLVKLTMYGIIAVVVLVIILILWITQPLFTNPKVNKSEIKINEQMLKFHVRKLSEDFHPRNFANIDNLNATANYIKEEFEKAGGKVSEQIFKEGKNDYRNVIVRFGDESKERIVIGAHYDSCYDTQGADDNASGVAGLIELAKVFGKNKPPIQIELVAYTLEEPPFFATEQMGSFVHAKSLKEKNVNVRLMLSLEMIGYFSDEENSQQFPIPGMRYLYSNKGNFISVVGHFTNIFTVRKVKRLMSESNELPVYSINAPTKLPGVDFSDHRNYWHFGYDALMITDTAFFRNKNYHTTKDTADTLDYGRMARVVEATYYAVKTIAQD